MKAQASCGTAAVPQQTGCWYEYKHAAVMQQFTKALTTFPGEKLA